MLLRASEYWKAKLLKWAILAPKDSVVILKIKVLEPKAFVGTQNKLESFPCEMV